jgi:hypothetical protein
MKGEFLLPIDMFGNWDEELEKISSLKSRLYDISGLTTGLRG